MKAFVLAIVLGLFAAACTNDAERPSRPTPAGPVTGGRLVIAIADDVGVLDPQLASEPTGFGLIRATQRGLMAFPTTSASTDVRSVPTPGASLPATVGSTPSPVPAANGAEPVPDLAESVAISADGLTYTFPIRDRVAFGPPVLRALGAGDVKAGLERALRLGTPIAPVLRAIAGAGEFESGRASAVAGINAPSADRLVIRLARPANDLLWALAHPAGSAIPTGTPRAVAPDALAASGPYRVERVRPGEEIVLVRNGAWDPGSDPVRKAYVDQIRVVVGTADGADVTGEGLVAPAGTETRTVPAPCVLLLFLSARHPRLGQADVRRGIALAIDRTRLIREASTAAPELHARPYASLLPPGSTGAPSRAIPAADAVRARPLIGGGAIPLGRESTGADARADEAVAAAVAGMLAAAGLPTSPVRPLPPGSIYDRYEARAIPMGIGRWCADWPGRNGRSALGSLVATGAGANWSSTSDAEFDSLIAAAAAERAPARIAAAWRSAEQRAAELLTVIPLAVLDEAVPVSGRVRGFDPHPFYLRGDPTALWLDSEAPSSPAPAVAAGPGTLR